MIHAIFGGLEVDEAEGIVKTLSGLRNLTRREEMRLRSAQEMLGRRNLIRQSVFTALTIGTSFVLTNNTRLFQNTPYQEQLPKDPQKGSLLRQEINSFEESEPVNAEAINTLYTWVKELYQATFGRNPTHNIVNFFEEKDINGIRSTTGFEKSGKTGATHGIISLFVGKREAAEPSINQLSIARGILMRDFMNNQAVPPEELRIVRIGNQWLLTNFQHGFTWSYYESWGRENIKGYSFDRINVQLLTQHLNDPEGQDRLFEKISDMPNYREVFPRIILEGAKILGTIYQRLGITIGDVDQFRSSSRPEELFELIDKRVTDLGVKLKEPASLTLFNLSVLVQNEAEFMTPLRNLAQNISQ